MREIGVVAINPLVDGDLEFERVVPFVAADNVFFDGAHDSFSVGVSFGIGRGGKELLAEINKKISTS